MVTGLEPKLAPDEKVLYRAHYGLGQIARHVLVYSLVALVINLVGLVWIATVFRPDDRITVLFYSAYWIEIVISAILFAAVIQAVAMWRCAAAVTNHRLLYRSGFSRAKIRELPLQEIEGLDLSPGLLFGLGEFLSVHRRGREALGIEQSVDLPGLWRVLALRTNLPAPPPAVAKIRAAYIFLSAMGFLCGFASLGGWAAYLLQSLQSDTWLLTALSDSPFFPIFVVLLVVSPLLSMALGMKVGVILALVVVRALFTFAEARDMACMGYEAAGRHRWCGAKRRFHQFCQKFLGLLYGQTIRCD